MIPPALTEVLQTARVHIFDVDHTLTRYSTGRRFAQVGHSEGLFSLSYLISLPLFYVRYRLGQLTLDDVSREIKPLTGVPRDELEGLAETAWQRYIRSDLYPAAEQYIHKCLERGAEVILASASFDLILQPLARHLGVSSIISSELEYRDDRATGWTTGGPAYGARKAEQIVAHLATARHDPATCAFYSDSHHDLPSFRSVGHPVTVHPDTLLRRYAIHNLWPVCRWNRV